MKIIISKRQLNLIRENIENLTDSNVLNTNLTSKPELIPLYQEIETKLNDKFTQNHFDNEINYSGGLKDVAPSLNSDVILNFENMLKKYGLGGKVKISTSSLRDYEKQKNTFIENAIKNGGKIKNGLRQAALPGFSQHHTGKTLDVSPSKLITDKMLNSFGFKRPYPTDTGFRMPEPWHIIYVK